jgi:S-adenosylmethionine-diacylglycerol 3-amino-3-carboxypropyl transferase
MGVGEVMSHLYNFGLSQEDERSEARALDLRPADRVLSIVSAGEMPLSLLSMGVARVLAVDIDPAQLHLARLKLAAVCALERSDAIRFLGYRTASPDQRHDWFDAVLDHLPLASRTFWRAHRSEAGSGAIWAGRFEQYLARITRYAIPLLGRRRVTGIFECRTLAGQQAYFDSRLDLRAIRLLLRVAFNRKVYASRGMDPRSLQYRTSQDEPLGVQFYRQFRNALTRTPARENYLMQLILLGSTRSDQCVPAYLTASGYETVRRNRDRIEIREAELIRHLTGCPRGSFGKVHLSNLPDWMDQDQFDTVLMLVNEKIARPGRAVWRYLHRDRPVPGSLDGSLVLDRELGGELERADRFPFYGIRPAVLA